LTVEAMIAEDDLVAARPGQTATHRGEFRGIPPSNRAIVQPALAFYRCADGKLVEAWGAERARAVTLAPAAGSRGIGRRGTRMMSPETIQATVDTCCTAVSVRMSTRSGVSLPRMR
jgi:hypothetical protein